MAVVANVHAPRLEELALAAISGEKFGPQALFHRAAHVVVTETSTRPALYYALRTLTGKRDHRCVGPSTEIVIEGFPRSANSSTVRGFVDRQTRRVEVAHHTHHVAQLLRAVERHVPAVMLIRRPVDAIQSVIALAAEGVTRSRRRGRGAYITFEDQAWAWLRFYRPLVPRREALVIGRFEYVTQDVAGLIRRVNDRFGTCFGTERQRDTSSSAGWHALPNALRSELKVEIEDCFAARMRASRELRRLIDECQRTYDAFEDTAGPAAFSRR